MSRLPAWLRPFAVSLVIAVFSVALALASGWALQPLDWQMYDRGLLARPQHAPEDIVILGIDEAFMAGRHAYLAPRDRLAKLIAIAAAGRPKAITVDVWLDSRIDDGPHGVDAQLRQALLTARGLGVPVYLSDIPVTRGEAFGGNGQSGQSARGQTLDFFKSASAGSASVILEEDEDGAVRSLPASTDLPFLPALMANSSRNTHYQDKEPLDYCGGPGAIATHPAVTFLQQPYLAPLLGGKLVFIGATYPRSADFVASPYSLRGHSRPFYGVEVLAQATNSLRRISSTQSATNLPRRPFGEHSGRLVDIGLCFVLAVLAAVLAWRGALTSVLFTVLAVGLALGAAVASAQIAEPPAPAGLLLWLWQYRYHPPALFCLALPLASALAVSWRQTQQARELKLVRDAFGAYVGPEVLAELGGRLPELGGEVRAIAVLFCDIRGYSALAESMQNDPKALMNELNGHFQPLVGALKAHGAYVDNYVGDLVMALFNAPVQSGGLEQAALKAVAAANDFVRLVHERNTLRIAAGELPIEVGIGLHCGEAVVGNLGALDTGGNQKIHYTAIGDTVNIASRVESATRGYGVPLLVTEEIVAACGAAYPWEFVAETQVKGRVAPVRLYKVH